MVSKISKKDQVWQKAKHIRDANPDAWRRDVLGHKIRYGSYGTDGKYSWEIDHIHPKSKGGGDNIGNLQPLRQAANRAKGNKITKRK